MMSVYFIVMTMCSGMEGCLEERKTTAYATRDECMQEVAAMPPRKGLKYKCAKAPQRLVKEDREAGARPHLMTISGSKTAQ